MYVGFIDLEKAYNRVKREALWGEGGKLVGEIKSMYVDSLACVIVQEGESERFRIHSGVRQGCIISPWLFNVYMDPVIREVKMGICRMRVRFLDDEREWRLPGLLYADDLVLCGERWT